MICILILYSDSWKGLADIVLPNANEYAHKHGYYILFKSYPDVFSGYEKIRHINAIFKTLVVDAVWSLDLDTLITNHTKKIEDFIDNEHDYFICKDYNSINAGSFIIRKSEWSENFMQYVMEQEGKEKMYCEQNGIEAYMKEFPNDEKIKILPHPSINSYLYENYPDIPPQTHEQGEWIEGDFLLHLPGIGLEKRIEIMSKIKPKLYYDL